MVGNLSNFLSFTNDYCFAIVLKRILALTMDSSTKETHRYDFEFVKAARTLPEDMAKKAIFNKKMRFNVN
tara:strand:+ start:507 stop:716 length:210 start_codon:yes stop_codon:yes gene_type:complete